MNRIMNCGAKMIDMGWGHIIYLFRFAMSLAIPFKCMGNGRLNGATNHRPGKNDRQGARKTVKWTLRKSKEMSTSFGFKVTGLKKKKINYLGIGIGITLVNVQYY